MKQRLFLLLSLGYWAINQGIFPQSTLAQVTTDGTTNTKVNVSDNDFTIQEGERAGNNLFHSFRDFSVPTDGSAFFNHAADIVNIFSRVTGGDISNIDGLLRANGAANLFLINPAGIIFGESARLDIGGSFIGSTAESLLFEDGEFSAADLDNPPLLTINVPIGLNLSDSPGNIVNRSVANGVGLEVETGKNLALVGGDISLDGGILRAFEGNIELVSIAGNSIVKLEENSVGFDFQYDDTTNFGKIKLTQKAIIDSTGGINLKGNQIFLQDGSQVRATIVGSVPGKTISINAQTLLIEDRASISSTTIGEGNAGDINIKSSESIEIVGTGFEEFERIFIAGSILGELNLNSFTSGTGISTGTTGSGTAGSINLNTSNLSLITGAIIGGFTSGEGTAGNLTINSAESIKIVSSGIFNIPTLGSIGNGSIIDIDTTDLIVSDGGMIASVTFGDGIGGEILVNAREQINLLRTPSGSLIPTGIFSNSVLGNGNAGDIVITTQRLNLQKGAQLATESGAEVRTGIIFQGGQAGNLLINAFDSVDISGSNPDGIFPSFISAASFTSNNAGNLTLSTQRLSISEGGGIFTSTIGGGNGGNLIIDASKSIIISGTSTDGQLASSILSSSGSLLSISEFNPTAATGDAGSLSINTGSLSISDNGRIAVNSLSSGDAGILEIRANDIKLENKGQIFAETVFGAGGNITLNIDERLTLHKNSLISAKAEANANGGNISINTNFLVAVPNQNNDIIASAQRGKGGNINITAEALFGLKERPLNPLTNDINASSEFGVSGTVAINNPDVDPTSGLIELPDKTTDPSDRIIAGCAAAEGNSFTITGRGGLPEDPTNIIRGQNSLSDLRDFTNSDSKEDLPPVKKRSRQQVPTSIVQVNGWIINQDGEVELVAALPQKSSFLQHPNCQDLGRK
ncbi:MAG: filamentous hemagglutinin N-terminal domain-containing protein [Xenococcus sp. (in: cyanobacteria)]